MPQLPITKFPSPELRKKSAPIQRFQNTELDELIKNMTETLAKNNGLGLAAPQIGKDIQLILVSTKDGVLALCNPRIIKKSLKKNIDEEGCLSVPQVFGTVKRHNKIKITANDRDGKKMQIHADGMLARVIQHEIDHLNGILFIDKVIKITQGADLLKQYENKSKIQNPNYK